MGAAPSPRMGLARQTTKATNRNAAIKLSTLCGLHRFRDEGVAPIAHLRVGGLRHPASCNYAQDRLRRRAQDRFPTAVTLRITQYRHPARSRRVHGFLPLLWILRLR